MALSDLRTSVRLRANVPSTDGVWTDAFIDGAVNEALVAISLAQPWPWLETVHTEAGDGTGVVDLSAVTPAVRDIRSVFVGSYEAHPVSTVEIDGWETNNRAEYVYATAGDDLLIRSKPAATDTITVRYFRNEPILSGPSDVPIMPTVYLPAVVEAAVAIGHESLDDQSSAQMHQVRSDRLVRLMEATALRKARGPHSVRVRPGSAL